jgi:hypothetical protein
MGSYAVNENGYVTVTFLIIRALIFGAIIFGMMHIRKL